MTKKDLISINDLSRQDIEHILDLASTFEENPHNQILKNKIIALLFYEPSTRTRTSFETAIHRLGGHIIGFSDIESSSVQKGESLYDTIKVMDNYADLLVLRHPNEGSARYAAEVASSPVINAGDGTHEHPTQTLLDLYSIKKTQGTLNNLNIFFVGDIKHGRTVHSLLMALSKFENPIFNFIAPDKLQLPEEYHLMMKKYNIKYFLHSEFTDIISEADIIYMTRVQKERFDDLMEYELLKDSYILHADMLRNTRENLKILHPLPRVNEIHKSVDASPKAYYFQQALNGVFTRQAIISYTLDLMTK